MKIEEKKIDVIEITLTRDEAHDLAMALDDHIGMVDRQKGKQKVACAVMDLFEYLDDRGL